MPRTGPRPGEEACGDTPARGGTHARPGAPGRHRLLGKWDDLPRGDASAPPVRPKHPTGVDCRPQPCPAVCAVQFHPATPRARKRHQGRRLRERRRMAEEATREPALTPTGRPLAGAGRRSRAGGRITPAVLGCGAEAAAAAGRRRSLTAGWPGPEPAHRAPARPSAPSVSAASQVSPSAASGRRHFGPPERRGRHCFKTEESSLRRQPGGHPHRACAPLLPRPARRGRGSRPRSPSAERGSRGRRSPGGGLAPPTAGWAAHAPSGRHGSRAGLSNTRHVAGAFIPSRPPPRRFPPSGAQPLPGGPRPPAVPHTTREDCLPCRGRAARTTRGPVHPAGAVPASSGRSRRCLMGQGRLRPG